MARVGRFGRLLRASARTLLTPAEDPRAVPAAPDQTGRTLLAELREAATRLAAIRAELAARRVTAESDELGQLAAQIAAVERELAALTAAEHRLAARLDAQRTREALATARHAAARAEVSIGEALTGLRDPDGAAATLARTEAEVDALRARAAALDALLAAGTR